MTLKTKDRRLVRELYRASLTNENPDRDKVATVLAYLSAQSPVKTLSYLKAYRKLVAVKLRQQTAQIESAVVLTDDNKKQIEKQLMQETKARTFDYFENKKVLGGIRITIGDTLIDYSLLNKFESLTHVF